MKTIELKPLPNQKSIIHAYCRYNKHPVYIDPETGNKFFGVWTPPNFPEKQTDISYSVDAGFAYRPDLISYEFYDTVLLAWVIAYVNDIVDPLDKEEGFFAGRIIRIPDITTITSVLGF